MAVAIVQDDRVVLASGFGVREVNKPERVTEHTLFMIASNTKAFTAAAVAILVNRHVLSWDDRVQNYLPWYSVFDDPWISHEVRLDDLLSHRIGFRTFGGDLIWYNTPYDAAEVVKRSRYLKPSFPFRRGYGYSNISFIAAGEVIAAAAHTTYPEFIRREIFAPLAMKESVLSVRELANRSDYVTPHAKDEQGNPYPIKWPSMDNTVAAGGIISCALDLAQWLRVQLGQGEIDGRKLWSPQETWRMWSMQNPTAFPTDGVKTDSVNLLRGYGLGWGVADRLGEFVVAHAGGTDGMSSYTMLVPARKIGVVVLTNGMTGISSPVASYAIDRLLNRAEHDWSAEALKRVTKTRAKKAQAKQEKAADRIPDTSPSRPLADYAGTFGGPMYGDANVAVQDGRLVLSFVPNPELTGDLIHWQHDVFEFKWHKKQTWFSDGKLQFLLDANSKPVEFRMDVPNNDFWFDELEFKRK